MFFSDIPGLEPVKHTLRNSVQHNHVAHAQLFISQEGAAGLPMALAYAAYLNCLQPSPTDACGQCPNCQKIHKHIHPDVHYVMPVTTTKAISKEPLAHKFLPMWRQFLTEQPFGRLSEWTRFIGSENKQATISKEESRQLLKSLTLKAFEGRYKVMLVWLPELLHPTAANALLKILEEPPTGTVFLLVSAQPDQVLTTIKSRCQLLHIADFNEPEIAGYLVNNLEITEADAAQLAQLASGSLQEAIQLSAEVNNQLFPFFREWMRAAFRQDFAAFMQLAEQFQKMGRESQKIFFKYALNYFRKGIIWGIEPILIPSVNAEETDFLQKFSPFLNPENGSIIAGLLSEAHYHIERNANPKIVYIDLSMALGKQFNQKKPLAVT